MKGTMKHVRNQNNEQSKNPLLSMKKKYLNIISSLILTLGILTSAQAARTSGSASEIPAYYDGKLLTIQFVEFKAAAEKTLLQHNTSLNFIYQSDPGLPGGKPFISVIDAVPADGFNPIWEEVQITFTSGHTARQL